jgi:hypothetical protein
MKLKTLSLVGAGLVLAANLALASTINSGVNVEAVLSNPTTNVSNICQRLQLPASKCHVSLAACGDCGKDIFGKPLAWVHAGTFDGCTSCR